MTFSTFFFVSVKYRVILVVVRWLGIWTFWSLRKKFWIITFNFFVGFRSYFIYRRFDFLDVCRGVTALIIGILRETFIADDFFLSFLDVVRWFFVYVFCRL